MGGRKRKETFPETVLEYDQKIDVWRSVARIFGRSHHASVTVSKNRWTQC